MQEVGRHLQVQALPKAGTPEGGQFGRSAYNRYYYATFLSVRSAMASMDPRWGKLPHANIPSVLEESVAIKINKGREIAARQRDPELVSLCNRALAAIRDLCVLLKLANGARKIADYNPDIVVEFKGADRFALNGIDISTAHSWHVRSSALSATIVNAWRQIHV